MTNTISIHIDTSEVDVATAKVERLVSLLKEANSLADELAPNGRQAKSDRSVTKIRGLTIDLPTRDIQQAIARNM